MQHTQTIRPLTVSDARDLLALRLANRDFLTPFDPLRPDEFFTLEAQAEIARNADGLKFAILDDGELVASAEHAELFLYPGDEHYFADSSLPSYDAEAAALLTRRVLDFLRIR